MSRTIARASLIAVVVLSASGAGAAHAPAGLDRLTDEASARAFAARVLANTTRSGAAALEQTWRDAGLSPDVPRTGSLDVGAPGTLGTPVAILAGAVEQAERMRVAALASLTAADLDAIASPMMSGRAGSGSSTATHLVTTTTTTMRPRAEHALRKVDPDLMAGAAVLLARAAERALPLLPRENVPLAASTCGATGDMVFEASDCTIMIGNTGANSYPDGVDPEILIDLGGDDTYTNETAFGDSDVRLVIDVGGDDTYDRTVAVATPSGPIDVYGQGAGILGVGVLVDASGNDSYRVSVATSAPQPGPIASQARAVGQGAGFGGAGALIDLDGSDDYLSSAHASGAPAFVAAQGTTVAGAGALVDLVSSQALADDSYTAEATSTLHLVSGSQNQSVFNIGSANPVAQGAGELGVGVLADAMGNDEYRATGSGGAASTVAQGAGVGGAGLLVDADGHDSMEASARGEAELKLVRTSGCWVGPGGTPGLSAKLTTGDTTTIAQGAGLLGAGALVDGGGDDDRLAASVSIGRAITDLTNSNCSTNSLSSEVEVGSGLTRAQGSAEIGVGVLIDAQGADVNELAGTSEAEAIAKIHPPGAGTEHVSATADDGTTKGQGHQEIGLGLLLDGGGDDAYVSEATTAEFEVASTIGAARFDTGTELVQGYGVGLGLGWLIEVGGDDTYTTSSGSSAADDDSCWSNGSPDGRGRDISVGAVPAGCP